MFYLFRVPFVCGNLLRPNTVKNAICVRHICPEQNLGRGNNLTKNQSWLTSTLNWWLFCCTRRSCELCYWIVDSPSSLFVKFAWKTDKIRNWKWLREGRGRGGCEWVHLRCNAPKWVSNQLAILYKQTYTTHLCLVLDFFKQRFHHLLHQSK